MENWAENFSADQWATEFARAAGGAAGASAPRTRQEGYQFAADNPYLDDVDSFAKARTCLPLFAWPGLAALTCCRTFLGTCQQ